MVGELIRLRRAIQRNTPAWKRRLGFALGLVAAAVTWAAVIFPAPDARADALTLCLSAWFLGWMLGPILGNGAAVLRPEYFTLMPVAPGRTAFGLLSSVFAGTGTLVTSIAVSALVLLAVMSGEPASVVFSVLSSVLFVVLLVALSRVVYALLGSAMRTALGVQIAAVSYGAFVAVITVGWLLIVPLIGILPAFLSHGFSSEAVSHGFRWSPAGWPVAAIESFARGDTPAAFAAIGALAVSALAAVVVALFALTPRARQAGKGAAPRRSWGGRPWRLLPASLLGAVVGRELRTWTRDPWRRLELSLSIWFGIFIALIAAAAGLPQLAVLCGVGLAVMVTLRGTNLYGYDGTALWQLVTIGSDEAIRADIRGRQFALTLVFGAPALVLTSVLTLLPGTITYALPAYAGIIVLVTVGAGVAIAASVLWPTPGADPHRRINASDVGDNPLVYRIATWVTFLLATPTIVLAVFVGLAPGWLPAWAGWVLLPLAVGNGAVAWWMLGSFAARHLTERLPETLARLRHTASPVSFTALWASVTLSFDDTKPVSTGGFPPDTAT